MKTLGITRMNKTKLSVIRLIKNGTIIILNLIIKKRKIELQILLIQDDKSELNYRQTWAPPKG